MNITVHIIRFSVPLTLYTLLFLKDSSEMTEFTVDHLNTFTTVTLQLEPTEQVCNRSSGRIKGRIQQDFT